VQLYDNDLRSNIPEAIDSLGQLHLLFLHRNQLTGTLSPSIGQLIDLIELRVSDNKFTGLIPSEIQNLFSLRLYWAHFNLFEGSLPVGICQIVGASLLEFLQTDCALSLTSRLPYTPCACRSACCSGEAERPANLLNKNEDRNLDTTQGGLFAFLEFPLLLLVHNQLR
jgi:hypothetical protein